MSSSLVTSLLDPAKASYDYQLPAGEAWIKEVGKGQVSETNGSGVFACITSWA